MMRTYQFSPVIVYAICFLVGIIGGIYGIGGGSIVAPFFVAIIGLPVYTVAGAALMGTFITSVAGVIFYEYLSWVYTDMAVAPDWILGALFGVGGLFGMYLGARTQKFCACQGHQGHSLHVCSFRGSSIHRGVFRISVLHSGMNCLRNPVSGCRELAGTFSVC